MVIQFDVCLLDGRPEMLFTPAFCDIKEWQGMRRTATRVSVLRPLSVHGVSYQCVKFTMNGV